MKPGTQAEPREDERSSCERGHHLGDPADVRRELADFLRTRRARVTPGDVGLPSGGRRRTPGLRREEVAQLAAVSVSYYTWLEQARPLSPSTEVISALARTLRLTPDEHAYLLALARPPDDRRPTSAHDAPPEQTIEVLLEGQEPYPALATGPHLEIRAWNRTAVTVFGDFGEVGPEERNLLWLAFTDSTYRRRLTAWEDEARAALAVFRMLAAQRTADPWYGDFVGRLRRASGQFDLWWQEHDVLTLGRSTRTIAHPELGRLQFERIPLDVAGTDRLRICVFVPAPGSPTAVRLRAISDACRGDPIGR